MSERSRDESFERDLAPGWTAAEAAAVEDWHYRFAARTFAVEWAIESWGRRVTTPGIAEPEWNHVSGIAWNETALDACIADATAALATHGRRPVLVVTPWSRPRELATRLRGAGWRPAFKHLWSFFDLEREIPLQPVGGYDYVRVSTAAEMEEVVALFVAVYGEDDAGAPGYAAGLRRSLTQPGVSHHLIRRGGRAVGIGTVLVDGARAQIFNMVVDAEHRRKGLAEWLLHARLCEAREAGARRLTALSDNARIDRWLERRGFVPGWFSVGYAAPADDESAAVRP